DPAREAISVSVPFGSAGVGRIGPRAADRRARRQAARPGCDLRAARATELGEDVLDVGVPGFGEIPSSLASSAFVRPSAICRATWNSRAVSGYADSIYSP